ARDPTQLSGGWTLCRGGHGAGIVGSVRPAARRGYVVESPGAGRHHPRALSERSRSGRRGLAHRRELRRTRRQLLGQRLEQDARPARARPTHRCGRAERAHADPQRLTHRRAPRAGRGGGRWTYVTRGGAWSVWFGVATYA